MQIFINQNFFAINMNMNNYRVNELGFLVPLNGINVKELRGDVMVDKKIVYSWKDGCVHCSRLNDKFSKLSSVVQENKGHLIALCSDESVHWQYMLGQGISAFPFLEFYRDGEVVDEIRGNSVSEGQLGEKIKDFLI